MKKALILCITALFTHQVVASDEWYSRYNPLPYLSSAGSWVKEHKALTAGGLTGLIATYLIYQQYQRHLQQQAQQQLQQQRRRLQQRLQRQQQQRQLQLQQFLQQNPQLQEQADAFIDQIIGNLLPVKQVERPPNQRGLPTAEQVGYWEPAFELAIRGFANQVTQLEGNNPLILYPYPFNGFLIFIQGQNSYQNEPFHVITLIVSRLEKIASKEKIKEFQNALLMALKGMIDINHIEVVRNWLLQFCHKFQLIRHLRSNLTDIDCHDKDSCNQTLDAIYKDLFPEGISVKRAG